ncbi:MATE family efflux transporter [Bacteroidota bacterium]
MNKKILRLAIPNIISNVTIPLLGIVDLAILGHLESESYIGAIAIGGMIFNFLYWGFGFLRMGTTGFTAQSFGNRDLKESLFTLSRAAIVGIGGGLLLIILQKPIAVLSFIIIDGSPEVEELAAQYYYIRIFAAPATLGLYVLTGWFIGMQNTKTPMVIAIVVNVLNIVFNVIFVFGFGLKSDGVAYGTLIAQYLGLILGLYFFIKYYKKLFKYWSKTAVLKLNAFREFFKVNIDIFLRTLCLIFVFSFFTASSAKTNDTILAVNTLLLQFFMFFSFFVDGFAHAAEAMTGKYVGAKNYKGLSKLIKILFLWGLAIAMLFTLIYFVAGKELLWLLTDNQNIIDQSTPYFFWVLLIPLLSFPAFLWDGIYIGAIASKEMRNTMFAATFLVFMPIYLIFHNSLSNNGLWLALLIFLFSRGIFLTLLAKKAIFRIS